LWDRELGPFNYHFGVFEVLAHLEYMRRRGEVRVTEVANLTRWTA